MNKVLALAVSLLLCICASGQDILQPAVDGVLVDAVKDHEQGDRQTAIKKLTALLETAPDNDAAHYYLGAWLFAEGQADEAESHLLRAVQLDTTNQWYQDALALLYMQIGREDRAAPLYEKLVRKYPSQYHNSYILTILGDSHAARNRLDEAAGWYDQALEMEPGYPPALLGKADVLRRQRDMPGYFRLLDSVAADQELVPEAKCSYFNALFGSYPPQFFENFGPEISGLMQSLLRAHPGTSFISGILAAAYEKDLSFREFLTVLEMAYEVTIRDGLALLDYYGFYHGSGTLGPFGIAAGVGRIRGFDKKQLRNALAVAEFNAPLAPGVLSVEYPAMNKDGVPFGALTGALAVENTLAGFTGNQTLLHGKAAEKYRASLGREYAVMDLYFKPYTCCRWAHPAIDACLELIRQHHIDYRQIRRVVIRTFRQAAVMTKCIPDETDAAQYNIAYPVAAAVVHGDVGFGQVCEDYLKDPDVLDMMEKLEFQTDEAFDALFPARRFCRAEIRLADQSVYRSEPFEPRGEPQDGVDSRWLADKFRRITAPVLTGRAQENFLSRVLDKEPEGGIRGIVDELNRKENWRL